MVFEEYRGFILDGGRDEHGPHDGGHRRLSVARKELLIDILEMPGIVAAGGNPAVSNEFSVQGTMHAVAEFYNDKTEASNNGPPRGCDIDLHWVVRSIKLGPELVEGTDLGGFLPRAVYEAEGEITIGNVNPQVIQGSGYVCRDLVMRNQDINVFNGHYSMAQQAGSERDHHTRMREDEQLSHFVRLMLVSRWLTLFDNPPRLGAPSTGPATAMYSTGYAWKEQGALVAVSGIREEGIRLPFTNGNHYSEQQFNAILQWAIAHELGHLIIREQAGGDWAGGHYLKTDAVMTNDHPKLGGIDAVYFHDEETSKINLPNRASVPPRSMTAKRNPSSHFSGAVILILGTTALSALPVNYASAQQPKAELRLEVPQQKRPHREDFQYNLSLTNTGETPNPIMRDNAFISTRQLFLVTEVLETQDAKGLPSIEPGGSLHVTIGGDEMYAGGIETATWNTVIQWQTELLKPEDTLRLTDPPLLLNDLPTVCPRIRRFTWQFWWLIGDEVWAKSNVVEFEMVDLEVVRDGELIRMLEMPYLDRPRPQNTGLPLFRLTVDDEQWIYILSRRIATLPAGVEPDFYWDPASSTIWIQIPGRPELNVQRDRQDNFFAPEEQTPHKPELLVPEPDRPLKWSLP